MTESQLYDAHVQSLVRVLYLRDPRIEEHAQRVTTMALKLARLWDLPASQMLDIRRGALLHDIGKVGVPDAILHKDGPLTPQEQHIMRMHPVYAHGLLHDVPYLRNALDIPYCHHEKWDGSGYPRGLKGTRIPFTARLFAVVDVWDALLSDRPYRKAWSHTQALTFVRGQAGYHFDPDVVRRFGALIGSVAEPRDVDPLPALLPGARMHTSFALG